MKISGVRSAPFAPSLISFFVLVLFSILSFRPLDLDLPFFSRFLKQKLAFAMAERSRKVTAPRRQTIPPELEDLDDITISDKEPTPPSTEEDDHPELEPLDKSSSPATVQETGQPQGKDQRNSPLLLLPREIRNIIAGGMAGMVAKSIVAPIDRIKILYQVSSVPFTLQNVPIVARNIIRNEGFAALWKGNLATLVRVFPYSGIQFSVFSQCKMFFLKEQRLQYQQLDGTASHSHKSWGLTPMQSLVSGMVAGAVSVICTYPLDLARAQLAVLRKHKHDSGTLGFKEVFIKNYTQGGGIRGLFRGVTPTLVGILPYSGIAFAINEQGKRKIQLMTKRDLTTFERMQCGAWSGLFAQTLSYPVEVTRRRMQTIGLVGTDTAFSNLNASATSTAASTTTSTTMRPPTLTEVVRNLYKEEGLRGFFKGVSMNWMKGPIAFSISFTAFDLFQELLETEKERTVRLRRRFTLSMAKQ